MRLFAELRQRHDVEAVPFFPSSGHGLEDHAGIRARVAELRPAAIIHLAGVAEPAEAGRDPHHAVHINVTGTLVLAEAILAQSPATRLIYASSSEVYGRSFHGAPGPLDESAALEPASFYGVTKAAADLLLAQMAGRGLDVVRFRPFNHTGPGQAESYVVPAFARQIARIERGLQPPQIQVGNLAAERDFLDVRDVARAYATAALREAALPPGVALNLASGRSRRIKSILDALIGMSACPIAVAPDPARQRRSETPRAAGDATRARDLLGWSPEIDFATTLTDVLHFWRNNPTLT